jgi:hypothetical protein
LTELFAGELHSRVDHLIKVALDSAQLARDVIAQRWRNFDVIPVNRKVHASPFNQS